MSDTDKISRQARSTDKKPVMVYLPAELKQYLEERRDEVGLSMSAYIVFVIRQERRKIKE